MPEVVSKLLVFAAFYWALWIGFKFGAACEAQAWAHYIYGEPAPFWMSKDRRAS